MGPSCPLDAVFGVRARWGAGVPTLALASVLFGCAPPAETAPPEESDERGPLVARVEHFYATSPTADRLFHFFRDSLGLPEVWGYQRWGDFASGGLTLGNVVLELVWWMPEDGAVLPVEFSGIAFEPVQQTDSLIVELARRGVPHAKPDTSFFDSETTDVTVGWVNTILTGMLPDPRSVFFCDYAERERVARGRREASDALVASDGGPLGVIALREIVLSAVDVEGARAQWRSLLDAPSQESEGAFTFGAGPRVRLVPGTEHAIAGIVVQVRSLEQARSFLAARGWLGAGTGSELTIAPDAIDGLHVALTE
jgi:hypothetical protein